MKGLLWTAAGFIVGMIAFRWFEKAFPTLATPPAAVPKLF